MSLGLLGLLLFIALLIGGVLLFFVWSDREG